MTTEATQTGREFDYQYATEINGVTTLAGIVETFFNPGSKHVRQAILRLPAFKHEPTVTATIHSKQSPGPMFAIFNIDWRPEGDHSICKISAQVIGASGNEFLYHCNFIIVGELGQPK